MWSNPEIIVTPTLSHAAGFIYNGPEYFYGKNCRSNLSSLSHPDKGISGIIYANDDVNIFAKGNNTHSKAATKTTQIELKMLNRSTRCKALSNPLSGATTSTF